MNGGVLQGSLLARLIRKIGSTGKAMSDESASRNVALHVGGWIAGLASGSRMLQVLRREGALSAFSGDSHSFGLLSTVFNRVPKACGHVLGRLPSLQGHSVTVQVLHWLTEQLHLWTALFLCAILLVPHGRWNNLYSTAGVFVLFALLLLREASQEGMQIHTRRLGGWFFLYMLFQVLAFASSVYPSLSTRFLAFHGTDFLVVLLLVSCFRTLDELVTSVELLACTISVSALYGVYQGIRGVPIKVAEVDTTLNTTGVGRVYGFYDNPNNFAEILILFLPFIAALFFASRGWKRRAVYGLVALPPLAALLMTQSRSSWGGLAIAMFVFAVFLDWRLIPLAGLVGVVSFPFLPLFLRQRVLSIFNAADTSASFRTKIWQTMLPVIREYWWTGLGLGNDAVMKISARYMLYTPSVPLHCHNVFLQTWVETGILGLVSLLGFIGATFKRAIKGIHALRMRTAPSANPHARFLLMAGLSSLSGILVTSIVEYTWYYPRVMLMFWVVAGLLLASVSLADTSVSAGEGEV